MPMGDILGGAGANPSADGSSPMPPPAPAAPVAPAAADPNAAHDTLLGRTFKALTGNRGYDYRRDPDTGQMIATPRPSGGFPWAGLIAGALMGGAAAAQVPHNADGSPNVAGSVATGGAAAVADARNQDMQAQKSADADYAANLASRKDKREEQEFQTRQQVEQAHLALYNTQTLRENQQLQGETFAYHEKVAESGRAKIAPYIAAGLSVAYKDIPETEMHTLFTQNPKAQIDYDWEPTGTKVTIGPDGTPHYEETYSAVKPGNVTVTPEFSKMVNDSGLSKYYPGLKDVVKPGAQLDTLQFLSLKQKLSEQEDINLKQQKERASIDELKARTHEANVMASKAAKEMEQIGAEKRQAELFHSALSDLDKNNGDFSKISPSSRVIIAESVNKLLPAYNAAIKNAVDGGDEATAKDLMTKRDALLTLSTQAFQSPQAAGAQKLDTAFSAVSKLPPDQQEAAITSSSTLSQDEKNSLLQRVRAAKTAQPAGSSEPKPFGDFTD